MTEPLDETPKLNMQDLFKKAAVERFQKRTSEIERSELRHYNQLITHFDERAIHTALRRFQIPIESRVTVYGGFTGQFAESLRKIGMRVVFTDPLSEWVEQARKTGFESFRVSVQEMPKQLIERTDLFASFECYPDLIGESEFYYPMMRFLTVHCGILFAESRETVASMHKETPTISQELGTFRRWFRPLYRVYGIQRKVVKTEHLNFYHLFAEPETRKMLVADCNIMKVMYDTYESNHRVTVDEFSNAASRANLDQNARELSFERLWNLSESIHAPFLKSMPFLTTHFKGSLYIGSKKIFVVHA